MKKKVASLAYKLPMAGQGLVGVLKQPAYAVLAFVLSGGFGLLMYFFINFDFYWPLMTSRLSFLDKLGVVVNMASTMGVGMATTHNGALLLVVSVLQGAAFSVMVFSARQNKAFDKQTVGGGGIAMIAAALGLGCVPCGTSLIMPIMTLLFSSSAYAAANTASVVVLAVALLLSVYSLYRVAGQRG